MKTSFIPWFTSILYHRYRNWGVQSSGVYGSIMNAVSATIYEYDELHLFAAYFLVSFVFNVTNNYAYSGDLCFIGIIMTSVVSFRFAIF